MSHVIPANKHPAAFVLYPGGMALNSIIYLVGLVVVVLFILSMLGLR